MLNIFDRLSYTLIVILTLIFGVLGIGCMAEVTHKVSVTDFDSDTQGRVTVTQPDLSKLPLPTIAQAKQADADRSKAATNEQPPGDNAG